MKTYVFDIYGTICENDGDYTKSIPLTSRIDEVNALYDEGHTIIFQTARGMGRTDNNAPKAIEMFYDFTERQLKEWNVKYHKLFLGKPAGDIYVDDKGINDQNFFTDEACP